MKLGHSPKGSDFLTKYSYLDRYTLSYCCSGLSTTTYNFEINQLWLCYCCLSATPLNEDFGSRQYWQVCFLTDQGGLVSYNSIEILKLIDFSEELIQQG